MRRWPDTLPTPSMPGFGLSPVDPALRSDMEVGAQRVRRITTARHDLVEMAWVFTDAEFAGFRAWWDDAAWSLAGDSDVLTGWGLLGSSITADAVVGPDEALADRIVEEGTTGQHRAQVSLGPGGLASSTIQCAATLKAAGRTQARLGLLDRAGVLCYTGIDLSTGALGSQSGLLSSSSLARGNGWWRVVLTAASGIGAPDPSLRITAMLDAATQSYAGSGTGALNVCEVTARLVTGYDLFLRTDAAGNVQGAAGSSAWVFVPIAVGGGFKFVEARFKGPFKATATAGLNWNVSAQMEVRNA